MVVRKGERRVQLFSDGQAVAGPGEEGRMCFAVGLGPSPVGDKSAEGDGRTPEGWFRTSDKPWSSFYGAIAVHYPAADDAEAALAAGRISEATAASISKAVGAGRKPPQQTALGGEILLHGGGSGSDWTLGCIALDNDHLDALRAALPPGMATDVLILP